jgi:hypothetical protein
LDQLATLNMKPIFFAGKTPQDLVN